MILKTARGRDDIQPAGVDHLRFKGVYFRQVDITARYVLREKLSNTVNYVQM
jgi:hypothetical protein